MYTSNSDNTNNILLTAKKIIANDTLHGCMCIERKQFKAP